MKDIELLPPEQPQPPIKKRSWQWWNLLLWAVYSTLWMVTVSKLLLRHYHAVAMWVIPCLAALAIVGWLALLSVLRAPEIPVGKFRSWTVGTIMIGLLGCMALLFAL